MLTEEQKRMHRVCFTGHRPEKLKQSESVIVKALETAIKEAIADGKNVFISGMARGVDIWAAEIVLRLRNEGQNVKLICASPYEGFERGWSVYFINFRNGQNFKFVPSNSNIKGRH